MSLASKPVICYIAQMKTLAIIAEFNPFHRGHEYLIQAARQAAAADFVIIVMSGDFVQRGAPAILDKRIRTRMALLGGADLVLELPLPYASASAEYFARGAVCLLDRLGVVDELYFGSECGDIHRLEAAARALSDEDPAFKAALLTHLKAGCSYPLARSLAADLDPAFLAQANNILGCEYIRALNYFHSPIRAQTLLRQGAAHHDAHIAAQGFSSASAIRQLIYENAPTQLIKALSGCVPENCLPLYEKPRHFIGENDVSQILHYKLLAESNTGFSRYFDVSVDLSKKIVKHLPQFINFNDFATRLKSKDLTYLRIQRALIHILLDIHESDLDLFMEQGYIFYARLLGFGARADDLLALIKKRTAIPLISKLADAARILDENAMKMLNMDIHAAHVYDSLLLHKYGVRPKHECRKELVISAGD